MTNRGGARPGAGRKRIGTEKAIKTAITLIPSDREYLLTISPNISAAIRILVAKGQGAMNTSEQIKESIEAIRYQLDAADNRSTPMAAIGHLTIALSYLTDLLEQTNKRIDDHYLYDHYLYDH